MWEKNVNIYKDRHDLSEDSSGPRRRPSAISQGHRCAVPFSVVQELDHLKVVIRSSNEDGLLTREVLLGAFQ